MNGLFRKQYPDFNIIESSVRKHSTKYYFAVERNGKFYLVICDNGFTFIEREKASEILKNIFPFLNPVCAGLKSSFGFGDRTGYATSGHILAVKKSAFFPVFAQQSARELERTGRSFQQVLDDVIFWCFVEGWSSPFGADADHVKNFQVLEDAINAGYTFFTIDPSDKIKNPEIEEIKTIENLPLYINEYSGKSFSFNGFSFTFTDEMIAELASTYGRALDFVESCYLFIYNKKKEFDFEVSVDETKLPTTPFAHVFIVLELIRRNINFKSLALRFPGKFEKGIDYKGDTTKFAEELEIHAHIRKKLGPYKISLHSGSDKFSIYRKFKEILGDMIHVKTSGTSWIQAMKTIAVVDRDFFIECMKIALDDFEKNSASYEISADVSKINIEKMKDENIDNLFLNDDIRQLIHISYGSIIGNNQLHLKKHFFSLLERNLNLYTQFVDQHISSHIELLQ